MIKRITVSSVLMALAVVCLFAASTWPVKVAMTALASILCTIVIIECGTKYAWLHFAGVSILALLIVPKKFVVYIYILFLGYYPIIKLYIEKLNKLGLEWFLKVIVFNTILAVSYTLFKLFLMPSINPGIAALFLQYMVIIIISLEFIFIFSDLALSYLINFYKQKIKEYIKI